MRRNSGFTLLELLLALALAAMILTLLAGGSYMVVRDWERSENRLDASLDASLALLQLERALQGAYPHVYKDKKRNRDFIYFAGEKDELTWVSTVAADRDSGLTAWHLARGEEDKGLAVKRVPAFVNNPEKNLREAEAHLLFEKFKVSFEYLYIERKNRSDETKKEKWRDDWSAEKFQRLPDAVRLRLEPDPGEPIELIALIAAYEHERLKPKPVID